MSHTDVHTPYRVKMIQKEWQAYFVEFHDHSKHECNYSITNTSSRDCGPGMINRGRNIHCGCRLCTGQVSRRLANRSERQRAKRLLRDGRWDENVASRLKW